MAVTGLLTSYGLTGGVPVSIDAVIDLLDPTELPFQRGYMLKGFPALPRIQVDNKKWEWQDDTLLDAVSTLNEGGTLTAGDTTITVTDGTRFKQGDAAMIEDEIVYVSSVAGNDLTATRGWAGTTAASHADGSRIIVLGQTLPEGNDAIQASHVDRTRRYNMTQIFGPRKIQASGTEQVMPKYGLARGGEWAYQIDKEMMVLAKQVERAIIYGQRYDDGADQRMMGGLLYFITTNHNSTSGPFTLAALGDQMQNIYDQGAAPGEGIVLAMNLANKRVINALDASKVQLGRMDNGRGDVVDYMDTDTGRLQFLISRYFENSDAVMYSQDQMALGTLRPWSLEPLAKTGDADSVQLVGEFTTVVKRQSHAAKFSALTLS